MSTLLLRQHALRLALALGVFWPSLPTSYPDASAAEPTSLVSLEEWKRTGAHSSHFRNLQQIPPSDNPKPNIEAFDKIIRPILNESCVHCHDEDTQEGNVRIDRLDPDLFEGEDGAWWLEVLAVLTKSEMPPPKEGELSDEHRAQLVDWLTTEIQRASHHRRTERGHTPFRRLTRFEFNHALQDLLRLPLDFSRELPPDPRSEDGFENSSDTLHLSLSQFETYRNAARKALQKATIVATAPSGERPPTLNWTVPMYEAATVAWNKHDEEEQKLREKHKDDKDKLEKALARFAKQHSQPHRQAYYWDRQKQRTARAPWSYGGARYAHQPTEADQTPPDQPIPTSASDTIAVLPPRQRLIVELGDRVPDWGTLRVRVVACRASMDQRPPSLQLEFGWQASNDSAASVRVSHRDLVVDATPNAPKTYEWKIPLTEVYPRNSVRGINKLGDLPSPSEFLKLVNASESEGQIHIYHVEVATPIFEQWPPEPHQRLFPNAIDADTPESYAHEVLQPFMERAWRRPVTTDEVARKVSLYHRFRPVCDNAADAWIEVLATILASPQFLYTSTAPVSSDRSEVTIQQASALSSQAETSGQLSSVELASRLSLFLWASIPDEELQRLANQDALRQTAVLTNQVTRMLADSRSQRFSKNFVRQWLGLELLEYLDVDREVYPHFDKSLKEAMLREPVEFFHQLLCANGNALDLIHSNYTYANERLARHYGIQGVFGNHFRRVELGPAHARGGLLTQPGLLAMNSDGKDSHPLKRGIWLLRNILNDPPPPPPPAVPEIDLADPEIAKLSLKERMEDHRNDPACMSCHAKIDPWGIAFEDFDAVGSFRTKTPQGKPADSLSQLVSGEELAGMEGLKRYLLAERQDQFVRALVHKLTTYALGRPLAFADRAAVDQITSRVRKEGDGLSTIVRSIVLSPLFRNQ